MPTLLVVAALGLVAADPIAPDDLIEALQAPPTGAAAEALAGRIRASFPPGALARGGVVVRGEAVAFAVEVPTGAGGTRPRLGGMVNHGRGLDLIAVGETGVWALADRFPIDAKFAYEFRLGREVAARGVVEMPGWAYPPESARRPGVAYGAFRDLAFRSEVFGNDRRGSIYVPAAYDGATPAALLVVQDGSAYRGEHVAEVVENLIAEGAMPTAIVVLLDPGTNDDGKSNRSVEYDTLSDRYARFLESEVIPRVRKDLKIRDDAASHAILGASSGGICAFTAAWSRPDLFGRACAQIGSFTNIRGGDAYPALVREAPRKAIRVVLTDGTNDLINQYGDWWAANEAMDAALREAGYDVTFLKDRGFHAYWSGGRVLPEALRQTWKDRGR